MSNGVAVGQGKKSVVHSRFEEALAAKLDRGREGDKWNWDSQDKREDKTGPYYSY